MANDDGTYTFMIGDTAITTLDFDFYDFDDGQPTQFDFTVLDGAPICRIEVAGGPRETTHGGGNGSSSSASSSSSTSSSKSSTSSTGSGSSSSSKSGSSSSTRPGSSTSGSSSSASSSSSSSSSSSDDNGDDDDHGDNGKDHGTGPAVEVYEFPCVTHAEGLHARRKEERPTDNGESSSNGSSSSASSTGSSSSSSGSSTSSTGSSSSASTTKSSSSASSTGTSSSASSSGSASSSTDGKDEEDDDHDDYDDHHAEFYAISHITFSYCSDFERECFENSTTYCVGLEWSLPEDAPVIAETDSVEFAFEFVGEQTRHNPMPTNPWGDE